MRAGAPYSTFIPIVALRALPEGSAYPDTGCKVSPSCFTCPLAECVFDAPLPGTALRAWQGDSWRAQAQALLASGAKRIEIQRQLGLSRSTIYRSLRTA